jgi:hypothetical protein
MTDMLTIANRNTDIEVGDRITFRAVRRWSGSIETRVVNGFHNGNPTVRLDGIANFVVRRNEISKVFGPRWGQ